MIETKTAKNLYKFIYIFLYEDFSIIIINFHWYFLSSSNFSCFYCNSIGGSPHGVVANVLDCNIVVSSNSSYAITFIFEKSVNLFIPQV